MGIKEALEASGFRPEASTDGEWQPYNGTYRCSIKTLRPEFDEKNKAHFVQAEYDIEEVLAGDMKRDSKFPAFKQRFYIDWENPTEDHLENAKNLSNQVFTASGKELDWTDKPLFVETAKPLIGHTVYLRAWGWTPEKDSNGNPLPEDQKRTIQQFRVVKQTVAEKKRSASSVAF